MAENTEKRKALEMAMSQIEKQFGKGSVMKLGEFKAMECRSNTNRSFKFRYCIRNRWSTKGRIIEIFGPESSGKTTLHYI